MTPSSLPKARRIGMMLALCLAIEASAPAPALAWFGWLDEWSGPGKFWGVLYEARLLCFGPDSGIAAVLESVERAQVATRFSLASQQTKTLTVDSSVVKPWLDALVELRDAQIRWNAPKIYRNAVSDMIQKFEKRETILLADVESVVHQAIVSRGGQIDTMVGTGMLWSACSDKKERRVSIELNVNDWHGFDNQNNNKFSGGTSIRLITVMPSVTWRVLPNRKADMFDLGIAAGYYAFSSKGFESVDGFIVEPVRLDVHAPPSWAAYPRTDIRRVAAMVTFRAGVMTIPKGFAADAFAPGSHHGPIDAEIVPTIGLFFNLNSLFSKTSLAPTIQTAPTPASGASRPPGGGAPW